MNNKGDQKDEKTLAYTDLIKEISYGNIEKIEMTVGSTTVKVKVKNVEEEKHQLFLIQRALWDMFSKKLQKEMK